MNIVEGKYGDDSYLWGPELVQGMVVVGWWLYGVMVSEMRNYFVLMPWLRLGSYEMEWGCF